MDKELTQEMTWAMGKLLEIAEEHYPQYSSCDRIAECNDILVKLEQYGQIQIKR